MLHNWFPTRAIAMAAESWLRQALPVIEKLAWIGYNKSILMFPRSKL